MNDLYHSLDSYVADMRDANDDSTRADILADALESLLPLLTDERVRACVAELVGQQIETRPNECDDESSDDDVIWREHADAAMEGEQPRIIRAHDVPALVQAFATQRGLPCDAERAVAIAKRVCGLCEISGCHPETHLDEDENDAFNDEGGFWTRAEWEATSYGEP